MVDCCEHGDEPLSTINERNLPNSWETVSLSIRTQLHGFSRLFNTKFHQNPFTYTQLLRTHRHSKAMQHVCYFSPQAGPNKATGCGTVFGLLTDRQFPFLNGMIRGTCRVTPVHVTALTVIGWLLVGPPTPDRFSASCQVPWYYTSRVWAWGWRRHHRKKKHTHTHTPHAENQRRRSEQNGTFQ